MRHGGTITLMAAAMLLAGACAGPSRGSPSPAPPGDLTTALAGLCRAADLAQSGDRFGARRTFQNQAHDYLHEVAARAEGEARPAVARLLEAKQRGEVALGTERGGTPAEVAALLSKLEAATRDLAGALGMPAPRCGEAGR